MDSYDNFQQSIIGALLLFDKKRQLLLSKLRISDFTDEPAKEIFSEISEQPQADQVAIIGRLSDEAKAYAIIGCENAPMMCNAEATVDSFVEQSIQKWLLSQTQLLAFSPSVSIAELKELVEQVESRTAIQSNCTEKYLQEFYQKLETIPTGFKRLDNLLNGGFTEGTISAIGARPSTGKTTFAINILKANLDSKSVLFSLEMSGRMIYDRIMADNLGIEYGRVHRHSINQNEFEAVKKTLQIYENVTVIDDVYEIEKITAYVYAHKPKLAIIDFVQIISAQKKFVDNRQRIDYISQALKKCAKETKCSFVVLSQITRAGKDAPSMSDLKESGGLEQDSDYIILLHRPYVNDKESGKARPSETKIILDKNKFGNTGVINYNFNGMFQRFTELEEDDTQRISKPINTVTSADDLPF
jgi:replicative DNA helicase